MPHIRKSLLSLIALSLALCAAGQPPNISGSWKLNLDQSKWGKRDKPTSSELAIEHNEPSLKYKGSILNADATDKREFKFEGAIDGKPYPAEGPDGTGTLTYQRVNQSTIHSTYKSSDGKVSEDATISISSDGKRLSRRVVRKGPAGSFVWTEVYDRAS